MKKQTNDLDQALIKQVRELEGVSREWGYQKALSEVMKSLKMLVGERDAGEISDEDLLQTIISEMSFMSERGIKESKEEIIQFEEFKKMRRLTK